MIIFYATANVSPPPGRAYIGRATTAGPSSAALSILSRCMVMVAIAATATTVAKMRAYLYRYDIVVSAVLGGGCETFYKIIL